MPCTETETWFIALSFSRNVRRHFRPGHQLALHAPRDKIDHASNFLLCVAHMHLSVRRARKGGLMAKNVLNKFISAQAPSMYPPLSTHSHCAYVHTPAAALSSLFLSQRHFDFIGRQSSCSCHVLGCIHTVL